MLLCITFVVVLTNIAGMEIPIFSSKVPWGQIIGMAVFVVEGLLCFLAGRHVWKESVRYKAEHPELELPGDNLHDPVSGDEPEDPDSGPWGMSWPKRDISVFNPDGIMPGPLDP